MLNRFKKNSKNQSGEIMLEAAIVFVPFLILVFAMMSISFFFYQEALMYNIAAEIASDIGKNYKYTDMAVGESNIDLNDYDNVDMFRTTFKKNKYESKHQKRAQAYVDWRVAVTSLGLNPGDPEVECKMHSSGLGRVYVTVTVSQKTDFFLSGVLDLCGITEEETMFSVSAMAECSDMMGYTSIVNMVQYAGNQLKPLNGFASLYESVKNLINQII